jgi:hypothetical protein
MAFSDACASNDYVRLWMSQVADGLGAMNYEAYHAGALALN